MMKYMKICKAALMAMLAFSLVSCYDDEGGNDHDSVLDDVEIVIPQTAYSGSLGEMVSIKPVIKTSIDASDLEYHWEVKGNIKNSSNREQFISLVDDDQQAETLNYVCKLDSNVTALNKSYECRLRVHQKSTGRDFYSASTFNLTIEGITGLMVLYADGGKSDVGMLQADEFMPATSSLPSEPSATMSLFSINNDGKKLEGNPISVYQGLSDFLDSDEYKDRMRILVRTDQETYWLNRNDLSIIGDWNEIFYLKGERKVNDGNPKNFVFDGSWAMAFDGDDVFVEQLAYIPSYLFPTFTPETECMGYTFKFAPLLIHVQSYAGIQRMMYADAVNGDSSHNGFVGINDGSATNLLTSSMLLDTGTDNVVFNPGDMKAELVNMNADSRGHVVAVLKGKTDNPTYAGKYFFADLDAAAENAGESTYANIPVCLCDMSTLPSINNAFKFEFGSTINMLYYATPEAIYHYGIDGIQLTPALPLTMTDGASLPISGEITMMKMLRQSNLERHDDDEILLVATYDGSASALYALHLDPMTGNVERMVKYDSNNVKDWGFGKIYDVNVKAL